MKRSFGVTATAIIAALIAGVVGTSIKPLQANADASWVTNENAKQGDSFEVSAEGMTTAARLSGYATKQSVIPGESVTLRATSTASDNFKISAYRIGWYGGKESRLVWESGNTPINQQPDPLFIAKDSSGRTINMVTASNWHNTATVPTTGWPSGTYILKLSIPSGEYSYVPLVVRSTSYAGKVVIINATATWQAYNQYGGYSAYYGLGQSVNHSRKVSFDRPYEGNGIRKLITFERASIMRAEQSGVNLAYASSEDVYTGGYGTFKGAAAVVTLGHDEYWTNEMVYTYKQLRDSGTNFVFLGGNTMWWRVRYEDAPVTRIMTIYKNATEDPATGINETVNFSRSGTLGSVPLLGVQYTCGTATGDMTVTDPTSFIFANTGASAGSKYPGLIRHETDRAFVQPDAPSNLRVVAHTPIKCGPNSVADWSDFTYYTTASGAGVIATGTMAFNYALDTTPLAASSYNIPAASKNFAAKVYSNILTAVSTGPLASRYPSQKNSEYILKNTPNPYVAQPTLKTSSSNGTGYLSGSFAGSGVKLWINGVITPATISGTSWSASVPMGTTYGTSKRVTVQTLGSRETVFGPATYGTVVNAVPRPTLYASRTETQVTINGKYASGTTVKASVDGQTLPVQVNSATLTWKSVFSTAVGNHTVAVWAEANGAKSTINATNTTTSVTRPSLYVSQQLVRADYVRIKIYGKGRPGNGVEIVANGTKLTATVKADGTYEAYTYMGRKAQLKITVRGIYTNDYSPINSTTITTL